MPAIRFTSVVEAEALLRTLASRCRAVLRYGRALVGQAGRMSFEWEEEWKLGRLAEDNDGEVLRALKGRMYRSVPVRGYTAPAHRSSRVVAGDGRTVCYVRVESRRKGQRADREAALREARRKHSGRREYVFPPRGSGKEARAAGAVWDRRIGAHYMPPGAAPAGWVSGAAEQAWAARERAARARSGDGLAAAHLRYVERGGDEAAEDIATDGEGVIVVSNVGETLLERATFWERYEAEMVRNGQISHIRLVAELPHMLEPDALRRAVVRMSEELSRRGLPHVGVVHRPSGTGDPRNVHVHWLIGDRTGERVEGGDGPGGWRFAARKDRTLRGPAWIAWLREIHVDAANGELAATERKRVRDGMEADAGTASAGWRRWTPGAYRDLGIDRTSQLHLGPHDAALERAGIPTWKGVRNGALEDRYDRLRAASEDLAIATERAALAGMAAQAMAASLGGGPLEREAGWSVQGTAAALDQDLDAHRHALQAARQAEVDWLRGERARRRRQWAERELDRSVAARDPARARLLRAASAEAGAMVQALGGDDRNGLDRARMRARDAAGRVGEGRGLHAAALEALRRERLLGDYIRADERLRRLRRLPAARSALAAAHSAVDGLGLAVERIGALPASAVDVLLRASSPAAAAGLVETAAGHLRDVGLGPASVGSDPSGAERAAVRAIGEALRLERLVTRLEVERARSRRNDPVAERARAEDAIRADTAALRLAIDRGLLAAIATTAIADGANHPPPSRGGVEI